MKANYLICDVCDEVIQESNGIITVKRRWYSWGLSRNEEKIQHVCSDCWAAMGKAAREMRAANV